MPVALPARRQQRLPCVGSEATQPQPQRPRVLYVIDTLNIGGAEQSILRIASGLTKVEPMVCYVYAGASLRESYESAGLRIVGLDVPGRYGFVRGIWRLRSLLRRERPDLVHATLFRAGIMARIACWIEGVPLIDGFVNDSYARERWARLGIVESLKLQLVRLLDRLSSGLVTHFVAISETVAKAGARELGIDRSAVSVIYRGREPDALCRPSGEILAELSAELNVVEEDPVVLNVARLLERKGQRELLNAFRLVLEHHPRARLLIAGDGPERQALQQEIQRLGLDGSAILLGSRTDIAALLHLAHVFAFPSHFEGHGGALVEAMQARRPIVATDTLVHRESIKNRETGLLVPLGDEKALADAIIALLSDRKLAARLADAAQADALERFTVSRAVERHEELYLRLLGERAHASHAA